MAESVSAQSTNTEYRHTPWSHTAYVPRTSPSWIHRVHWKALQWCDDFNSLEPHSSVTTQNQDPFLKSHHHL